MNYSPLRYPGGKNKISPFIAKLCLDNNVNGHYVEPFCGGAAVALFLLLENYVERITINDKDRSIYAFWHSLLNRTNDLCELIDNSDISIPEWHKQKLIQNNKSKENLLKLGFSTFYLNRVNRSGIIGARPIGGMKQEGEYKMDCRFNKVELIGRIRRIAKQKKRIKLYKKDALKLIDHIVIKQNDPNTIFYFDPPYYLKASSLYLNYYNEEDHKIVSDKIKSIDNMKWIVSYDNVGEIRKLYRGKAKKEYSLRHTSNKPVLGKEILFFSPYLKKPKGENWMPTDFKMKRKTTGNNIYQIISPRTSERRSI